MVNRVKVVWQFVTSPNYSRTVSILALLVVVLAIPLTVFIAQKQQEIRQRAQTVSPTQCPSTYDGQTLADQLQEAKDAYKDNEAQWIQDHNSKLAQEAPQATDKQTLFNATCEEISSFYSYYRSQGVVLSEIPQRWVNERDAKIRASTPTSCKSISLLKSQVAPGELINVTLDASDSSYSMIYARPSDSLLASQAGGGTFSIQAPSTPGTYSILVNTYTSDCSYFCDYQGDWQRNTTQREGSLCPADSFKTISRGGCTNSCGTTLVVTQAAPTATPTSLPAAPPPTATPIILPAATATPILTPTPTPVALCGHRCNSFTPGSKTRVADCDFSGQYLDVSETNGACMGSCAQIPVGYQRTPDKCGAVSTATGRPLVAAPPSSPGDNAPPAPTATPTPGGTQLTLNLILPEGKNQKRVIVQIFGSNNQQIQEVSGTLSSSGGGNYSGTIPIGSIASGAYNIKVKAAKYLKKLISNAQINAGATSSLPQITLKLGDMDGNNELNAADYGILYNCFGNKANTSECSNNREAADLNDDGRVDGIDYNLFLRSLATEPRQGD